MSQALLAEPYHENFHSESSCSDPMESSLLKDFPWLTKSYMQTILKNYYHDEALIIKEFRVASASGKGENYGGVLLRVFVKFQSSNRSEVTTSYVLKAQIWNDVTKNTLKVYDIHNKEMEIYEKVLPKIRKLLLEIGDKSDTFPNTIFVDRENEVIILEDLMLKNYKLEDRTKFMDREHAFQALSKIAKIHAASAVLYEQENTIYDSLKSGMFTRLTNCYHTFFRTFWKACTKEVATWEGYQKYADKMRLMVDDLIENACKVYDRDEDDLHVLTHGDFWTNNIMFNYNEDESIKDVVILDYQYCYYASPLLDFLLFIYTSTKDEIRLDHTEFLQFYHKCLSEALKQLNYPKPIPTLYQFRKQYMKKSFLKLTSSINMLPSMINEVADDADFESLMMDDEKARRFKKTIMSNPKFKVILQKLLPVFDREGLLDPLE